MGYPPFTENSYQNGWWLGPSKWDEFHQVVIPQDAPPSDDSEVISLVILWEIIGGSMGVFALWEPNIAVENGHSCGALPIQHGDLLLGGSSHLVSGL